MKRIRYQKQSDGITLKSTKPILVGSNLLDIVLDRDTTLFLFANTTTIHHSFKFTTLAKAKKDIKKWLQSQGVVFDVETRTRSKEDISSNNDLVMTTTSNGEVA
jgi:hypothetical protein